MEHKTEYLINHYRNKIFKATSDSIIGSAQLDGVNIEYKVVDGTPKTNDMLEVVDIDGIYLLVKINNNATERDLNYVN